MSLRRLSLSIKDKGREGVKMGTEIDAHVLRTWVWARCKEGRKTWYGDESNEVMNIHALIG